MSDVASSPMILVAGMHRSGTSAVTRMINLLGYTIPGDIMGPSYGNEQGHWESSELTVLHDAMLAAAGSSWNDIFGVRETWFASAEAEGFVDQLADFLGRHAPIARPLAAKDPRMAVLLPVWRAALRRLDLAPLVVLPFRDPFEVAASLTERETFFQSDLTWSADRGLLLWLQHVLAAERDTRGGARTFIDFDALLDDWRREAARMAAQIAVPWPIAIGEAGPAIDAFIDRRHRHKHAVPASASAELVDLVRDVLAALAAGCQDPAAAAAAFDRARHDLDAARRCLQGYVHPLEQDNRTIPRLRETLGREAEARVELQSRLDEAHARLAESRAELAAATAEVGRLRAEAVASMRQPVAAAPPARRLLRPLRWLSRAGAD